jgi:hypothetical protein
MDAMRLAFLVVGCLPMLGQTSHVSSVRKAPGDKVTLEISAKSKPKGAPVALKWEVTFPLQLMEMDGNAPELGSAAMDAGKTIACTARRPYVYACVLSGGQKPIADGTIAIYHFTIRATATAGTTRLKIENAEATLPNETKWILEDTEAIVIIQK